MPFSKADRKIFRFHDGTQMRGIDPLEADIAMEAVDFDWSSRFQLVRVDDPKIRLPASAEIVSAARKVFGVPEFTIAADGTESGLAAGEVYQLLIDFINWKARLMGFIEPPQTSPPSTEDDQKLTMSGTDSTLTSVGKSVAAA